MKLSFSKKHAHVKKKLHLELDPRRYWVILLSFFMLAIAIELLYFSMLFWKTERKIDAPANPTLETNALQIKRMNKTLENVEAALQKRTGETKLESTITEE